jgi:pyrimidine operon attenuation protein / uracil phosphoribosyltransferase
LKAITFIFKTHLELNFYFRLLKNSKLKMQTEKILLVNELLFETTIKRICFELKEVHQNFEETVLIGLQPRGSYLAEYISNMIENLFQLKIQFGKLDTTFHRDDIRQHDTILLPNPNSINFEIENKKVILIDDVLYTGRTIRAGLDALLVYGRPQIIELLVLVNRLYTRHIPIEPTYCGYSVDTIVSDKVKVEWDDIHHKNKIWLINN